MRRSVSGSGRRRHLAHGLPLAAPATWSVPRCLHVIGEMRAKFATRPVRHVIALMLAVSVAMVGTSVPLIASDDGAASPTGILTLFGQRLSELSGATGTRVLAAWLDQTGGQISGTAVDVDGQPLVGYPVMLARPERGRLTTNTAARGHSRLPAWDPVGMRSSCSSMRKWLRRAAP